MMHYNNGKHPHLTYCYIFLCAVNLAHFIYISLYNFISHIWGCCSCHDIATLLHFPSVLNSDYRFDKHVNTSHQIKGFTPATGLQLACSNRYAPPGRLGFWEGLVLSAKLSWGRNSLDYFSYELCLPGTAEMKS